MTYGDIQNNTPENEKIYYVYVWYTLKNGKKHPFYVGCSRVKSRCGNKSDRSEKFKDFVRNNKCYSEIVVSGLAHPVAVEVERRAKAELKRFGFSLIDAEEDMEEQHKRQAEGIAKAKARGVKFGRPQGEYPDFQKFFAKQKSGLITVDEACREMGISRSQWYALKRKSA